MAGHPGVLRIMPSIFGSIIEGIFFEIIHGLFAIPIVVLFLLLLFAVGVVDADVGLAFLCISSTCVCVHKVGEYFQLCLVSIMGCAFYYLVDRLVSRYLLFAFQKR